MNHFVTLAEMDLQTWVIVLIAGLVTAAACAVIVLEAPEGDE